MSAPESRCPPNAAAYRKKTLGKHFFCTRHYSIFESEDARARKRRERKKRTTWKARVVIFSHFYFILADISVWPQPPLHETGNERTHFIIRSLVRVQLRHRRTQHVRPQYNIYKSQHNSNLFHGRPYIELNIDNSTNCVHNVLARVPDVRRASASSQWVLVVPIVVLPWNK